MVVRLEEPGEREAKTGGATGDEPGEGSGGGGEGS